MPVQHGLRDVQHRRRLERACSRSISNASRSSSPWRSITMPFARSIIARRSSADSSCATFSCKPLLLAVAPHRDLDRALDVRRLPRVDVAGDPHVRRARDRPRALSLAHGHQHRAARELHRLGDQRQSVLVVSVEHHERHVGILARDQFRRLRDGDRERRHLVAERVQDVAQRTEIIFALIREKDPRFVSLVVDMSLVILPTLFYTLRAPAKPPAGRTRAPQPLGAQLR